MTVSSRPNLYLILSETWTMTDPRDLRGFVDHATTAERAGFDGVMVGEHVVMGPNSAFRGVPENPRDWLMAGNQDPRYPHPGSLVLLSAMAAVTTRLRLVAGALLSPLRHPLALAKDLATLDLVSRGRLVVIPGVSWQEEEYAALGVPFHRRGRILDEQLEIWHRLWTNGSPVSFDGDHFCFSETFVEPQPSRRGGPELWIGGKTVSPWALRRVARYGNGFFPIVPPSEDDLGTLADLMAEQGRHVSELQLGGFVFGPPFPDATSLLDLDAALESVPGMLAKGISNLVLKPSQFIDTASELEELCREVRRKVDDLAQQ